MGERVRWMAITAVAPIAWGSVYWLTRAHLPAEHPLWGAAIRALPAGLVLLVVARRLPRGGWWWRSAVVGVLNVAAFFWLVYEAAQRLPSSVASVVMATAPLMMALVAWAVAGERPRVSRIALSLIGLVGVVAIVEGASGALDVRGLLASVAALVLSSVGFVLTRTWSRRDPVPIVAFTAWQLVAGGGLLLVAALVVEGGPPAIDATRAAGFAYLALVATALAFVCWFVGLAHLDVTTVGVVGLLNPVTGVVLGTLLASERLTAVQVLGVATVLATVLAAAAPAGRRRPAPAQPVRPRARQFLD